MLLLLYQLSYQRMCYKPYQKVPMVSKYVQDSDITVSREQANELDAQQAPAMRALLSSGRRRHLTNYYCVRSCTPLTPSLPGHSRRGPNNHSDPLCSDSDS